MRRIRRTPQAEADLLDIWEFIAIERQAPAAADALLRQLDDLANLIATQPSMGESLERIRPGLRMFTHGNYVVFYKPLDDGALVYRVLHGARNWPDLI